MLAVAERLHKVHDPLDTLQSVRLRSARTDNARGARADSDPALPSHREYRWIHNRPLRPRSVGRAVPASARSPPRAVRETVTRAETPTRRSLERPGPRR